MAGSAPCSVWPRRSAASGRVANRLRLANRTTTPASTARARACIACRRLSAICWDRLPAVIALVLVLAAAPAPAMEQTEADEYTRYELLDPDSARFHILYDVSATAAGATTFFNPIRKGSEASDEAVFDRMTG